MQVITLEEQIRDLAPWHLDVQVTPDLSTYLDDGLRTMPQRKTDLRKLWTDRLANVYPDGLEGRSFLDCACNCGGYSFWAKELGAGETYGFDVHERWIEQAEFLREQRASAGFPTDDMLFEARDLYDLVADEREFDVAMFQGIFYHLPDPIEGLRLVAERTRELLIFGTATARGVRAPAMRIKSESDTDPLSGVYGLSWLPTIEMLTRLLAWCGFPVTRLTREWDLRDGVGRMVTLAARTPATFARLDSR